MTISELLNRQYDGYNYMKKLYPKAAKKRRIQKKWRRRFGPCLSEFINDDNFLLNAIPDDSKWTGGFYQIPINLELVDINSI